MSATSSSYIDQALGVGNGVEIPKLEVQWFKAVDIPKPTKSFIRDHSSKPPINERLRTVVESKTNNNNNNASNNDNVENIGSLEMETIKKDNIYEKDNNPNVNDLYLYTKKPSQWIPFSKRDSAYLEYTFQMFHNHRLLSNPDSKLNLKTTNILNIFETRRLPFDEKDALDKEFSPKVTVEQDFLYEADIEKMEISPIYWQGDTFEIRRGTWFIYNKGKCTPCDINLASQVETGFKKHCKFNPPSIPSFSSSPPKNSFEVNNAESNSHRVTDSILDPKLNINSDDLPGISNTNDDTNDDSKETLSIPRSISFTNSKNNSEDIISESRSSVTSTSNFHGKYGNEWWPLYGPYMNQYVIFSSKSTAWLFSDIVPTSVAKTLASMSGTKLVRGWEEAETSKEKKKDSPKKTPNRSHEHNMGFNPFDDELLQEIKAEKAELNKLENDNHLDEYFLDPKTRNERKIDHLVFVVHGVGQKYGERVDSIKFIHDCSLLRNSFIMASKTHDIHKVHQSKLPREKRTMYADIPEGSGVQVIPVQWRQLIKFGLISEPGSKDAITTSLKDITLDNVPLIRNIVSDIVVDVLLYMTPKYREEMVRNVCQELNRIYSLYIKRNPEFNGKVHIYGHSLGSLLTFDLLSNQPTDALMGSIPSPLGPISPLENEMDLTDLLLSSEPVDPVVIRRRSIPRIYPKLIPKIDCLFAVGSPLGLFLLLKGDRLEPHELDSDKLSHILRKLHACKPQYMASLPPAKPAIRAMYNIFHPTDPVSYRLEPIIHSSFSKRKPVSIYYTKGGLKSTIAGIEDFSSDLLLRGKNLFETAQTGIGKAFNIVNFWHSDPKQNDMTMSEANTPLDSKIDDENEYNDEENNMIKDIIEESEYDNNIENGSEIPNKYTNDKEDNNDKIDSDIENLVKLYAKSLNPNGRIDYVIQEGVLETSYLSSLNVHTRYWNDSDTAFFIMRELYNEPGCVNFQDIQPKDNILDKNKKPEADIIKTFIH